MSRAGIGTVLTAARFAKPIVLIPRRAALREHRNDHQLATVAQLATRPEILVAWDETELSVRIAEGLAMDARPEQDSPTARQLNDTLTAVIDGRSI